MTDVRVDTLIRDIPAKKKVSYPLKLLRSDAKLCMVL